MRRGIVTGRMRPALLNAGLAAVAIYLPLVAFSTFSFYVKSIPLAMEANRDRAVDLPLKIKAASSGYKPNYFPSHLKRLPSARIFPLGSLPLAPTFLCNEGYGLITYQSDRLGLRNPDQNWDRITNQETLLLIGDSFTHGSCVSQNDTLAGRLASASGWNILNLGQGDNGPYEYMATLRSILPPLLAPQSKLRAVVLIFYPNDNLPFNRTEATQLTRAEPVLSLRPDGKVVVKPKYVDEVTRLINANFPTKPGAIIHALRTKAGRKVSWKENPMYQIFTLVPVRDRVRLILEGLRSRSSHRHQQATQHSPVAPSLQAISLLAAHCKDSCQPYVSYIPNSAFWRPDATAASFKASLKEAADRNGVTFIDGEKFIHSDDLKDYAPEGPHLSTQGYAKMAHLIGRSVRSGMR